MRRSIPVLIGVGLATVVLAFGGNRAYLHLYWRLRGLNVTGVFLQDYYAAKQEALFLLGALYLILVIASNVDARLSR